MPTTTDLIDLIANLNISATEAITGVAAILFILLALTVIFSRAKRAGAVNATTTIGVLISLGTTVEGAVKFANGVLGTKGVWTALPAVTFEVVSIAVGAHAIAWARDHADDKDENGQSQLGANPYLTWVWRIAVVAAIVVSLGGTSFGESVGRFVFPLAGPLLLHLKLCPADIKKALGASHWRWTPTNFLIYIGARKPGESDTESVNVEYQTRKVVSLGHKIHRRQSASKIGTWLRDRREIRLQRLALEVDAAMEAEAADKIERACTIVDRLNPKTISANRQHEAEIASATSATAAALTEADHFRALSNQAASQLATLAESVADLHAEVAARRQQVAETEAAWKSEILAKSDLATRLTRAEETAATHLATIQQLTTELHKLELRLAAVGTTQQPERRQLVATVQLPISNQLPTVDRVAPATVAKVIAARDSNPSATQAEIAALAGVSARTVGTVLSATRSQQVGNPISATNGSKTPALIDPHE
jgi:hypothetical protein